MVIDLARRPLDTAIFTAELLRRAAKAVFGTADIQRTVPALGPFQTPTGIALGFAVAVVHTPFVLGAIVFSKATVAILRTASDLARKRSAAFPSAANGDVRLCIARTEAARATVVVAEAAKPIPGAAARVAKLGGTALAGRGRSNKTGQEEEGKEAEPGE